MPTKSPIIAAGLKAGRQYGAACRQDGRGHGHGPPAPYILITVVEALLSAEDAAARGGEVGGAPQQHSGEGRFRRELDVWVRVLREFEQLCLGHR